jgi:hypothetical protein
VASLLEHAKCTQESEYVDVEVEVHLDLELSGPSKTSLSFLRPLGARPPGLLRTLSLKFPVVGCAYDLKLTLGY